MDVILVSRKRATTKTITLRLHHLLLLGIASILGIACVSAAVNYALLRYAAHHRVSSEPLAAEAPVKGDAPRDLSATDVRGMAQRLAEMQAQLLRLDVLGNRLSRIAGFQSDELMASAEEESPRFDALPPAVMTLAGLTRQLDAVFRELDGRRDALGALESLFALDDVRRKLLPTSLPLEVGSHSSDFGWRRDPFTGERTLHEGIDFMGEHGAPILAAAGGVVVYSDFHPQYGNMVEIDHGNGLVTRYAHAARRMARVGDVVARGAQIGEVGSSGRATGNHLHFEVRRNGAPLNPAQFLRLRG